MGLQAAFEDIENASGTIKSFKGSLDLKLFLNHVFPGLERKKKAAEKAKAKLEKEQQEKEQAQKEAELDGEEWDEGQAEWEREEWNDEQWLAGGNSGFPGGQPGS